MKTIKVVDLFAGVGGLSYGFSKDDQFEIVCANEILPNMAKAYELNHPNTKVYCKDIKEFGLQDLKEDFSISQEGIDLIIGGPPCQAYSTVGKRVIDDPRGELFQEYFRVLQEVQPKVFIFENVKGLLSIRKGELFKEILELFQSLGYEVNHTILNAADFGVPQNRERIFIVGTKLSNIFSFPKETHTKDSNSLFQNLQQHITVKEAIGDLPFIKTQEASTTYATPPQNRYQKLMRKNASDTLYDHCAPNNNAKLVELMKALPDGGTPKDLLEELRPKSGFGNTYSRLWWEKPSTTITRNFSTPSSSRCIHPKAPRALTTREGARLQSFPDNYIFYGSRSDKNLQIGNAVPPILSIFLKDAIKDHFLYKQSSNNIYYKKTQREVQ